MISGFARGALRRRISRDARGLAPSIELPWMPPWGSELDHDLVDLIADVHVLQATIAGSPTWEDDEHGHRLRARALDAMDELRTRLGDRGLHATALAVRELAASLRAWESLAPRR